MSVGYKGVKGENMTDKQLYEFRCSIAKNLYASFDSEKKEQFGIAGILAWFDSEVGKKYLDEKLNV